MTKKYDLIVFDWDGTLLDSALIIADSIQRTCIEMRLPVPSLDEAQFVIGMGLMESIHHLVPQLPKNHLPEFVDHFRRYYLPREGQLALFDGAHEMLNWLNEEQHILAVATGKPRHGLNRSLKANQLENHFAFTRCADESRPKPHPEMLEFLIEISGVTVNRALMIGDTTHDLQMANNAGMDAIAVSYGAHNKHRLSQEPHIYMADSLKDLFAWFRNAC